MIASPDVANTLCDTMDRGAKRAQPNLQRRNVMKTQRLLIARTIANIALLTLFVARSGSARAQGDTQVLRGRALEIVDERGKVRASSTVIPAEPTRKMPDVTTGYPETVLLRLISSEGRPNVKIGASEQGAGMGLGGESDPTYVQILAERASTSLKLTNKDGREQMVNP
jgi:hypothetical protein